MNHDHFDDRMRLRATVIGDENATAVYVVAHVGGTTVEASATAKRHPHDKHDEQTGVLLATSRALALLAKRMEREASDRIDARERPNARHEGIFSDEMLRKAVTFPPMPEEMHIHAAYSPRGVVHLPAGFDGTAEEAESFFDRVARRLRLT